MGWFWADTVPPRPSAPHPLPSSTAAPPPGCPMHKSSSPSPSPPPAPRTPADSSACPYVPPDSTPNAAQSKVLAKLNPLNYMPELSNKRESTQRTHLPLERERSSIPKGDGQGNWEYPSPQQMYNAIRRKGHTGTEEGVESMVAIHNFLNEGAWMEIMEWERRFGRGLSHGWEACKQGEDGTQFSAVHDASWTEPQQAPQLIRFMGRPGELTPKAQIMQALGWAWPSRFGGEGPFDRHDWFVRRHSPDGTSSEVRYVIDYYSGPPEPTGEPVFFLDVRPAVDTPSAAVARMMRWSGDVWHRGTGGTLRDADDKAAQQGR